MQGHVISEMATFVNSQRTENTRVAYKADLKDFLVYMKGREPNEDIVTEWRDHLVNTKSNATAIRKYNTVRTFYNWMGGDNPFKRVKAPVRVSGWAPSIPDDDDITKMMSAATEPLDRSILALLSNGLRAQEVCDLTIDDYYYDAQYRANILRVTGKGGKIRLVPATSETVDALRYAGPPFRGMNIRKVYYIVKKVAKEAKVEGIHPHSFRHQYATRLIRAQVPVFSLQRLLGHTRADTTGVYVNLDLEDLVRASIADPRHRRVVSLTEGATNEIAG